MCKVRPKERADLIREGRGNRAGVLNGEFSALPAQRPREEVYSFEK
jgi:hypothetical protein